MPLNSMKFKSTIQPYQTEAADRVRLRERLAAFGRLEQMIKSIPGTDEKEELSSWREEKFQVSRRRPQKK